MNYLVRLLLARIRIASVQEKMQDFQAGEALCRRAVQIWNRYLWRSHPQLAEGYDTLSSLIKHQVQHDQKNCLSFEKHVALVCLCLGAWGFKWRNEELV